MEPRTSQSGHNHNGSYHPGFSHDALLPLYDPVQKLLGIEAYHRELADQLSIEPGHVMLEIGCGTGNLTILVKQLFPDATVIGLDPDEKALARARRKADEENLQVQLDRGFAESLPYPNASCDRVISAFMFHHLEADTKARALREARRVLRPGASLHLVDFTGTAGQSSGLIARLIQRSDRIAGNSEDRIPAMILAAGFVSADEIAYRDSLLGRITFYRGGMSETPAPEGG